MRISFVTLLVLMITFTEAQQMVDSQLNNAKRYLDIQQTDSAINLLKTTINSKNLQLKQASLELISKAHQQKGNDAIALEYLNTALILKDSTHNAAVNSLKSGFEIDQQTKELALQKEKNKNQQLLISVISIFSLTIIIVLLLVLNNRKIKSSNKLQTTILQHKNLAAIAILAAEEKERKRIASELHDGVGQLMSAAKMNLSSIASKLEMQHTTEASLLEKTIALVDESCKEVRTVSHNLMPNALLKTGLSAAIKSFLDKIDHQKIQVNLHTEGLETRLPDTIELILYRVVQETVSNVIKHAKANQLDISLIKDKDGLSCTVEDNGVGFDTNSLELKGIGLSNIKARISYLNGTAEWNSSPNNGTLVAIHLPM